MTLPAASVARNTALNLLGGALPLAVGAIALPVIVRGLGIDRLGLLGLGWVVLGYFAVLDLGVGRAATRFAAEALSRGARNELPAIIWSAVGVQIVVGLLGAFGLASGAHFLVELLKVPADLTAEALTTFRVLALALPIVMVAASFRGALEASRRFDVANAISATGGVLNYLVPAIGAALGWGLPPILWWLVAARALTLAAYVGSTMRLIPELARPGIPHAGTLRRLAGYGLWTTVTMVVSPILDQLDRFVLGALAGLSSVGAYTAPQEVVLRVRILPTAIGASLFPEFSGTDAAGRDRAPRFYAAAIRVLVVILAPMAIAVIFVAPNLLSAWLGPAMTPESAVALQWLAVGAVLNAVAYVPSSFLYGTNRPDLPAKFHLLELPAFLILASLLMPRWGAAGAGAAWAIRAGVDSVLLLAAASRLGAARGTRLVTPAAVGWVILTAGLAGAGFGANMSALGVSARVAAGGLATGIVFLTAWYGLLSADDRGRLANAVTTLPGLRGLR